MAFGNRARSACTIPPLCSFIKMPNDSSFERKTVLVSKVLHHCNNYSFPVCLLSHYYESGPVLVNLLRAWCWFTVDICYQY